MGDAIEYVCPYCATLYRHNPALAPNEARPAECELHDVIVWFYALATDGCGLMRVRIERVWLRRLDAADRGSCNHPQDLAVAKERRVLSKEAANRSRSSRASFVL
jgi:hypothetical protein